MSCYWAIGQAGIVLEIVGAATLVISAWKASRKILKHKTDIDHIQYAVDELISYTNGQFRTQAIGFVLLVLGLVMQFIGGFGS